MMKKNYTAFALVALLLAAILVLTAGHRTEGGWPLVSLEKPVDQQVAMVEEMIKALPAEVTLEDAAAIGEARAAYEALSEEQRAAVSVDALVKVEGRLAELQDKAEAQRVTDLIASIPADITADDIALIRQARGAYEALTPAQKKLVTNMDVLAAAEAMADVHEDDFKAGQADALIAALPDELPAEIDSDIRAAVAEARAAYDALTDEQKLLCKNLEKLEMLEAMLGEADRPEPTEPLDITYGDTVLFLGGSVYASANDTKPRSTISGTSVCTVTNIVKGKLHIYHLVSTDRGGVYGWVDARNIKVGD